MANDSSVPRLLVNRNFILTLMFSSFMFLVACIISADRSVWIDEATYLSNLHQNWQDYFNPLPFYDQGSPPLVSVLYSSVLNLVPNNVHLLRLFILLTSCLALVYFGWQVIKAYKIPHAVVSLMFLMCNGLVVRYFTETKQYAIEIAVSLVLIGFFIQLTRSERTDKQIGTYLFLMLSLLLTFFSHGASVAAAALMFDGAFFSKNKASAKQWKISFFIFIGVYILLYLFYFRQLVFIQFNNYHQVYQTKMLKDNFNSLLFWENVVKALSGLFVTRVFLIPCGVISLIVVASACKKFTSDSFAPARITLILFGGFLLLSGLGVYPLAQTRQFFFTVPFLALMIGWAVQQLIDLRRKWSCAAVLFMIFMLLLSGIKNDYYAYAGKFDFHRTKNLYEFVVNSGYKRILVECFIQPCMEFYAHDGRLANKILLGRLVSAAQVLPQNYDVSANYPGVFEGAGGWQAMIPIGSYSRKIRYELYTDWLISKVPDNEAVLLVTNGPDKTMPQTWDSLMNSIKKRGCSSEVLFEDSGVRALRLDCSGKGSLNISASGQEGPVKN